MSKQHKGLDGKLKDEELVRQFESIAPIFEDFAAQHQLFVRRYLHNSAIWALYFRHPRGGTGMLQFNIGRRGSSFVPSTCRHWYVDDDATLTHAALALPVSELPTIQQTSVVAYMNAALKALLDAEPSARSRISKLMPARPDAHGRKIEGELEERLRFPK